MKSFRKTFILSLITAAVISPALADDAAPGESPKIIKLQKTTGIKAVYQVSDLTEHEGVHKALFYANKVLNGYEKQGVKTGDIDLHLVYHSAAIPALLKDPTYQRLTGSSSPNPNAELLAKLVNKGVHIEICGDTMRQKDVKPADLLPGVDIVPGAFPRLIDLQQAGYAYIKFE